MPHTVIAASPLASWRRNSFCSQGLSGERSNTTRWPSSAPQRSMQARVWIAPERTVCSRPRCSSLQSVTIRCGVRWDAAPLGASLCRSPGQRSSSDTSPKVGPPAVPPRRESRAWPLTCSRALPDPLRRSRRRSGRRPRHRCSAGRGAPAGPRSRRSAGARAAGNSAPVRPNVTCPTP